MPTYHQYLAPGLGKDPCIKFVVAQGRVERYERGTSVVRAMLGLAPWKHVGSFPIDKGTRMRDDCIDEWGTGSFVLDNGDATETYSICRFAKEFRAEVRRQIAV